MIRSIRTYVNIFGGALTAKPVLNKAKKLKEAGDVAAADQVVHQKIQSWAKTLTSKSDCEVTVVGQDKIPTDTAVLFVANHQSNFDIPVLLGHIDKTKAFIAKIELETMPLISDWMKAMNCVFMDRSNVRQSVKAINQGAKNMKEGYSMVVFPEGTRSPDGQLGDFKPGSMKLATKAGVPIVPITINGSKDMMVKGSWLVRPAKVTLVVGDPIGVDVVKSTETVDLAQMVKNTIEENLTL